MYGNSRKRKFNSFLTMSSSSSVDYTKLYFDQCQHYESINDIFDNAHNYVVNNNNNNYYHNTDDYMNLLLNCISDSIHRQLCSECYVCNK